MKIPRKPKKNTEIVEDFIKKGGPQSTQKINGSKKGRRIISLSLMMSDAEWVDNILNKINSFTERKITRSEIISAAITVLKEKNIDNITELIKNR